MSAPGTSESPGPWAVAALLAGVYLNVVFLDFLGANYSQVTNVWLLAFKLSLYAAFLCFGVVYFPLRSGAKLDGGFYAWIGAVMGDGVARAVRNLLIPIWASVWFASLASKATWTLYMTMVPSRPGGEFSLCWRVLFSATWLLLITPAASGSLQRLAQSSVFVAKVSFALILGLALSSARYVPEAIERIRGWEGPIPSLEPVLLFWAVPPLVACSPLILPIIGDRRKLSTIMILGIGLSLCFAVLAALFTMAGASAIEVGFQKAPYYSRYAAARFNKLGWVKLLLLTFTLLTASRLAANLVTHTIVRRGGLIAGVAVTAGLLVLADATALPYWDTISWLTYISIPFAPLMGVLCGVHAAARGQATPAERVEHTLAVVAWLAGCAVASSPMWMPAEHGRQFFEGRHLLGWLVSFLLTGLASRLYPLMQNNVVRERR
jgi:hypothetical protein